MTLVTIDFHNTLFRCDEWFRLEVELLPVEVLRMIGPQLTNIDLRRVEQQALEHYRDIRQAAMDSGVECDAETSVRRVVDHLGLPVPDETLNEAVSELMKAALDSAHPRCGASELVEDFAARDVPMAVISSAAYHPFLEWALERYQLRSHFRYVVTSASCGIYKSNPQIYQHTLDLFDVEPNSAVHIGDSHRFDVASAAQIGMRTILLTDDVLATDLTPKPDAIISHLGEAGPQLDRLLPG